MRISKKIVFQLVAASIAATFTLAAQAPAAAPSVKSAPIPDSEMPRISEAFGNFIGRSLNTPGIKFDVDSLVKGIRDGMAGKPSPMSDEEYEKAMNALQETAFQQLSVENLKAAQDFLAKNAKETGVIEIDPGKLQYQVVEKGNGAAVTTDSKPMIKYTGKYINGTVFGSSEDVGGAITIPLDQTIPGFSKGIVGMKEGEKRKLFVHPDLGYGTQGQLLPNSLLIFDVEVVKADNPAALKDDDASEDDEDEDEDDN